MLTEDFSTKEMLLQLMTRVESLNVAMQEQRILLERHMQASLDRDSKIVELKEDLDEGFFNMDKRVSKLEKFQTKAMLIWSSAVIVVGFLVNKFLG